MPTRETVERIVDSHINLMIGAIQEEMQIAHGDAAGLFFDGNVRMRERCDFVKSKLTNIMMQYVTFEENQRG